MTSKLTFIATIAILLVIMTSCSINDSNEAGSQGLGLEKTNLWIEYSDKSTTFKLWSPLAEEVKLNLYQDGSSSSKLAEHKLKKEHSGVWRLILEGDLKNKYYTYQVRYDNNWLEETPGIYAQAVGVNGQRAMVVDLNSTNPEGWTKDKGPELGSPNDAIIYELHVRDMSIHPESGIVNKGKFLGLAEKGTKSAMGLASGLSHIKEMGVTHVHLLPSFDFASIDEANLDSPQFNWGYDPQNYNVPEGSYSTDPFNAEVRIKEFKEMVKAFHDDEIGVIMDVVYNHTGGAFEKSNFNLEYPGYYYRHWQDGSLSDAAACGNETASDKDMMAKFMIESVLYWAKEYHIDGFRFDLMAIHDITTMNELADTLKSYNPNIIIYGEGWTAKDSPLPANKRALKNQTNRMPQLSAFSDDIRDGLKGSVFDEMNTGFVNGGKGLEESVKFGIVGCVEHPDLELTKVNYSETAWARAPWQALTYVSCHDNHTLYDKLQISKPDASEEDIAAMSKLANAVVLTSQGIAFLHSGSEMLRTKQGNHNSYNSSDLINQINWNLKTENRDVLEYYKNLIQLRKNHPAFRMRTADEVRNNLEFQRVEDGLISYQISNKANGDDWETIYVIYNARPEPNTFALSGEWKIAVIGNDFEPDVVVQNSVEVPAISMLIAYQE